MNKTLFKTVDTYLATHQVMTLATTGPEGIWAAAVFYAHDAQFNLYFLSAGHTRHAQNMAQTPQVAVTIQEDYADWSNIQGVQLAGTAVLLKGDLRQQAIDRYQAKFPFLAKAPPPIQAAFQKVNWYQVNPTELYFVDNSKGFGHRDQLLPTLVE